MAQQNWARQLVSCTFKLLWFHLSIMCLHAKKYTDSSILYQYTVYLSIYNPDWPQHLWPKVVKITINLRWISISIQNITLTDHIFFEISLNFLRILQSDWPRTFLTNFQITFYLPSSIYQHTKKHADWLNCSWDWLIYEFCNLIGNSISNHAKLKIHKPSFKFPESITTCH